MRGGDRSRGMRGGDGSNGTNSGGRALYDSGSMIQTLAFASEGLPISGAGFRPSDRIVLYCLTNPQCLFRRLCLRYACRLEQVLGSERKEF